MFVAVVFLYPDRYAHVKRLRVVILNTRVPNLGVRHSASAIHASWSVRALALPVIRRTFRPSFPKSLCFVPSDFLAAFDLNPPIPYLGRTPADKRKQSAASVHCEVSRVNSGRGRMNRVWSFGTGTACVGMIQQKRKIPR